MQRKPDISRAREMLDWAPEVPLEAGLRKTITYFETLLAGKRAAVSASAAGLRAV